MKTVLPIIIAFIAALGNALVALGQQKAKSNFNPFWFGGCTLLFSGLLLLSIAHVTARVSLTKYFMLNFQFILISTLGFVLLNVFLNLLYQFYGTTYYTLYSTLAILTTSIGIATLINRERLNYYYILSALFAVFTILLFMKGKKMNT